MNEVVLKMTCDVSKSVIVLDYVGCNENIVTFDQTFMLNFYRVSFFVLSCFRAGRR